MTVSYDNNQSGCDKPVHFDASFRVANGEVGYDFLPAVGCATQTRTWRNLTAYPGYSRTFSSALTAFNGTMCELDAKAGRFDPWVDDIHF